MSAQPNPAETVKTSEGTPVAEARQGTNATAPGAIRGGSEHDLELIQGTWRSIEMVIDGRRIPPAALEHRRVTVFDDKYIVTDGDRTLRRGTLRINATTVPKQINGTPADGPNAGKVDQGIYEVANDLLRVCWAPPGQARPTNFAPSLGSKQWMATDQKETPAVMDERSRVIAVPCESRACPGMYTTRVHHRDYPELHGEGETPYDAALGLLQHLIGETDAVPNGWHRQILDQVIAEVRAFIDRVS